MCTLLVYAAAVALLIHPSFAGLSYAVSEFRPISEPLLSVSSPEPRTWLELRAQCNAEHAGYYLSMQFENLPPEVETMCPIGTLVPFGVVLVDGEFTWDNVGDLQHQPISANATKTLNLIRVNKNGTYGALVWPTKKLIMVGNETKFTCAICEMSRRLDVVTTGVYPPHNNSIFAYDLELISYSRIKDIDRVAKGSDLMNKLLGDLAEAFNISAKSLRWHGAELNDDQKAVVHVYYDPDDVNMDWFYYAHWNDQYLKHKTVDNFEITLITLNTECYVDKKRLMNVRRETFLTGFVEVYIIIGGRVVTRECYWDAINERSIWSKHVSWEPTWIPTKNGAGVNLAATFKLNKTGAEFKKALKNFDLSITFELNNELTGFTPLFSPRVLATLSNTLLLLHTMERPYASATQVMLHSIPISMARVYMTTTLNQPTELCHTSLANVLVADIDSADPAVGMALSLPNGNTITDTSVVQLNHGNMTLPPNTSHIVVTVSDSIAFSAKRLMVAAYAAHLDLPNQTNTYDDFIDGWMAVIHIAFKRDAEYTDDVDKDFIDIAFKPVFHSPTLRGKCAERDVENDEWFGDNCRILKSMRNEMLVCRCTDLRYIANITTNAYLIYGFDASLSTYLANNLTLVVVMVFVCFMSALGLLSVVLTAVFFPEWREDQGHKIFLQMTFALSVNMILGFVNNFIAIDTKSVACVGIGVVRHYSFLAMFFWMMVLSGLQVKRLTTISGSKSITHLILKVSLIAWGLPLIPIVVLLAWDTGFYKSEVSNRGYCYPEDVAFQATVQFPAGIILIANLVIFVIILNHIYGWVNCNTDVEIRKHTSDDRAAQLRNLGNSIFVFFLFGFTWTFHFLSEEGIINSEFLFEFMFLITASFHLFMLSLFFIVLDKKTRALWRNALGCKVVENSGSTRIKSLGTGTQSHQGWMKASHLRTMSVESSLL